MTYSQAVEIYTRKRYQEGWALRIGPDEPSLEMSIATVRAGEINPLNDEMWEVSGNR
jgi:hypothetical protein